MRILLAHDYAHLGGGAEVLTAQLRDGLRARGHAVRLLSTRAGGGRDADVLTFGTTGRSRGLVQAANPVAARDLRHELRRFSPDVVHLTMFLTQLSPLVLPLLRGVPAVWNAQWYRAVCPSGTKMLPSGEPCSYRAGRACLRNRCIPPQDWPPIMAQLALLRRWKSALDAITACSDAVARQLRAGGIHDVRVVPNGVPVRPARPPLRPPAIVAFAGRLVPEKGAGVLLEAFASLADTFPEAQLLVIGDGPQREALAARARTLGLAGRVELPGALRRKDVEARLDAAWVQVVPSRWAEPFGLVAAEAMMRGTAVIASGVGGLLEVVTDGVDGRIVAPDDPAALTAALAPLLANRRAAEELGARARNTALARFTVDRFVADVEAVLQDVTAVTGCNHA